jgi:purine-binding chemotaxis protein CheW
MEAAVELAGQYVTFKIGSEFFAANVYLIREILEPPEITKVPGMPEYMIGIINIRGMVVPIIDMKMKFGDGQTERTDNTAIIVAELENKGNPVQIGFLVDEAEQVSTFEEDQIEEAKVMDLLKIQKFIMGMGKKDDGKFVLILDIEKLLTQNDLKIAEEVGGK